MKPMPLRWLLTGSFALLLVVTLGVLGTVIRVQVEQYVWRAGEATLLDVAHSAWLHGRPRARRVRTPVRPVRKDTAQTRAVRLANFLASHTVNARVLAVDGTELAEAGGSDDAPPADAARVAELRGALERRTANHLTWRTTFQGEPFQVVLLPVDRNGRLSGMVQLSSSWAPARDLLAALQGYFLAGGATALMLGFAASAALSRRVVSPLERLAATAARVGQREGSTEVRALAHAFDRMVAQLQAAFQAQRRFVADASHELKTPLTAIGGMAEMLRSGAASDAARRDAALASIEREVDRMGRLVADLLTLSQLEQGAHPARAEVAGAVDVGELAREVVHQTQLLHPEHRVAASVTGILRVRSGADELRRVLGNLVDNAVKYTPPGGCVDVSGRVDGREVVLEVSDNGQGIAAEALLHVFDRFYRADPSRTRGTGGSGLGLAIVKAIVERHGGSVAMASQPGTGTTVRVRLPAVEP